jgi:D-glycero-D-manno-heptose 1,7-bisphosphate phosphatase
VHSVACFSCASDACAACMLHFTCVRSNYMRAVFLDRDGVLNRSIVRNGRPYAPRLDQFEMLPGVGAALQRLKSAGYLLIVVTNQPDVARGDVPYEDMVAMHRWLRAALPLDDIRACVAEDGPDCDCYKPKPGLLLRAARDYEIDLAASFMIGDRWRDVGAGLAAGCRTIFIDYHYAEELSYRPDFTVPSLSAAVDIILSAVEAAQTES